MEVTSFEAMTVTRLESDRYYYVDNDTSNKDTLPLHNNHPHLSRLVILEDMLRSGIRQADVYKRVTAYLLLNIHDETMMQDIIDPKSMIQAWRDKDVST